MNKKLLITSSLTMLMATSLMVGASYAIFTAESTVDLTVSSGTVKVTSTFTPDSLKLYSMDAEQTGKFENGGTAVMDGRLITLDKMTPGDKITFGIDIANESTVAIKYAIKLVPTEESALFNALTIDAGTVNTWESIAPEAAIDSRTVSVGLLDSVGNEVQNMSVTFAVNVIAVQGNGNMDL